MVNSRPVRIKENKREEQKNLSIDASEGRAQRNKQPPLQLMAALQRTKKAAGASPGSCGGHGVLAARQRRCFRLHWLPIKQPQRNYYEHGRLLGGVEFTTVSTVRPQSKPPAVQLPIIRYATICFIATAVARAPAASFSLLGAEGKAMPKKAKIKFQTTNSKKRRSGARAQQT